MANQAEKLLGVQDVETDQDLVVGQFLDKDGFPGFMVVNQSSPFDLEEASVTMTFDSDVTAALVYAEGKEKLVRLDDHKLTLDLGSGEGNFVIPL